MHKNKMFRFHWVLFGIITIFVSLPAFAQKVSSSRAPRRYRRLPNSPPVQRHIFPGEPDGCSQRRLWAMQHPACVVWQDSYFKEELAAFFSRWQAGK